MTATTHDLNWGAFDAARGTHPRQAAAGQALAPGAAGVKLTAQQQAQIKKVQAAAGLPQTGTLTVATVAYAKTHFATAGKGGSGGKGGKGKAKKAKKTKKAATGAKTNSHATKIAAAKKLAKRKKAAAAAKKLAADNVRLQSEVTQLQRELQRLRVAPKQSLTSGRATRAKGIDTTKRTPKATYRTASGKGVTSV